MNGKERRSINVAQKSNTFSETVANSRHECLLLCSLKNLNMKMLNTKSIATFLSWWERKRNSKGLERTLSLVICKTKCKVQFSSWAYKVLNQRSK